MRKKGLSIMIGYVLLISFAVVIGGIVYYWMATYVPKDIPECPEDVSIFIKDINCIYNETLGGDYRLILEFTNTGKFSILGYSIYGANSTNTSIATINLAEDLDNSKINDATDCHDYRKVDIVCPNLGDSKQNPIEPGDSVKNGFMLLNKNITLIEIQPIRKQTVEGVMKIVNCKNAKVTEKVVCET